MAGDQCGHIEKAEWTLGSSAGTQVGSTMSAS